MAQSLRNAGVPTLAAQTLASGDWQRRASKALSKAERAGSPVVVLLGEDELERGGATVKDMRASSQQWVERRALTDTVRSMWIAAQSSSEEPSAARE